MVRKGSKWIIQMKKRHSKKKKIKKKNQRTGKDNGIIFLECMGISNCVNPWILSLLHSSPLSSQRNISIVKHCLKIIQLKSAEFNGEIFAILSNAPNFLLHIDIQRDSLFFIIQKQQWDRPSAPNPGQASPEQLLCLLSYTSILRTEAVGGQLLC